MKERSMPQGRGIGNWPLCEAKSALVQMVALVEFDGPRCRPRFESLQSVHFAATDHGLLRPFPILQQKEPMPPSDVSDRVQTTWVPR